MAIITLVSYHETVATLSAPYYISRVPAGFPSPADDYMDKRLDLNEYLIKHPAATFYCRVSGKSMIEAGIHDGDLLIVDRAVTPAHGDVVLAAIDGELTCKILDEQNQLLRPANAGFQPIPIKEGSECLIEGVVIHSIRFHRARFG